MDPISYTFIGFLTTIIIACIVVLYLLHRGWVPLARREELEKNQQNPEQLQQELSKQSAIFNEKLKELETKISKMPSKVLDSITSSSNNYKGKLGELIGWLQLNSSYDRIIPFGDITDFIAIRFKSKDSEGTIDFIDIKNGPNAKLSKDQAKFKKLIQEKKINFVKVKIDTDVSQDSSKGD